MNRASNRTLIYYVLAAICIVLLVLSSSGKLAPFESVMREALRGSVNIIVDTVRQAIDETPPELISDLMEYGVALAGGGALLKGLAQRLTEESKMRVYVADDPMSCVARGAGMVLENFDVLYKTLASMQRGSTLH